jgi:hypothetical protein
MVSEPLRHAKEANEALRADGFLRFLRLIRGGEPVSNDAARGLCVE